MKNWIGVLTVTLSFIIPTGAWAAAAANVAPTATEKILADIGKLPPAERIKKLIEGARKEAHAGLVRSRPRGLD